MGKRFVLSFLLASCLSIHPVYAQEVTVTGMGMDKDSALRDASRLAVEQVVGTFIDSRTLMENLVIQLDEVYKKSQGFVKKITILNEGKVDETTYRVQARIDVDTNPNAQLMDQLTMLMRLNDPRIAVVVLNTTGGQSVHDEEAESALGARLLELGFNHVIDANHIIRLSDARLLNSIYEGQSGVSNLGTDNACEFLVLGKATTNTANVAVPDYKTGQMIDAPLVNARAKLNIKILKYDTGDLIGTFTAQGSGIGNNNERAVDSGLTTAAAEAAKLLEKTFKQFSSKVGTGMAVTIHASDYGKIEEVIQVLRSVKDINNVYIRSHDNGKTVLELDTDQKPHVISSMLRSRSELNIIVENMTNSSLTLRLP